MENVGQVSLIMGLSRGLLIGNQGHMIIGGSHIRIHVKALLLRLIVLLKSKRNLIKIIIIKIIKIIKLIIIRIIKIMIKVTIKLIKKRNLFRIIKLIIIYRLELIMIKMNK